MFICDIITIIEKGDDFPMFKKLKIVTSFLVTSTLLFMCCAPTYAISPSLSRKPSISLNTKITKNNLSNVLAYLGIDFKKVITITDKNKLHNVTTVNDLKNLIDQVKRESAKLAKESAGVKTFVMVPTNTAVESPLSVNMLASVITYPSKVCSQSCNISYYTLVNSICAQYSGRCWKKLCWEKCELTQDSLTVGYYSLKSTTYHSTSLTSSLITTVSSEVVDSYAGISVFGVGLGIPTSENTVDTTCYYYASVWL